jgi:uncharacterized membrane protein HdeD (DUF308 family)
MIIRKKYLPIYLYGAILMIAGIYLFVSEIYPLPVVRYFLGISLTTGGMFAFIAAQLVKRKKVQFAYHELHALAMVVYGISLILFCDTSEKLLSNTSFLFLFYALSEIILCNWLFNMKQKVVLKIIIIRTLLGLGIGIGAIVAMNYAEMKVEVFGVLFILVGINIILYIPVMKGNEDKEFLEAEFT